MPANRIRTIRQQRGLTLGELTARITATGGRIDRSTLSKLELGQRQLTDERAAALAAALDIAPGELYEGDSNWSTRPIRR